MNCHLPLSSLLSLLPLHVYLLYSHHLLATVYESKGEFRSALQHEREAYSIYKSQVSFKMQCSLMVYAMLCFNWESSLLHTCRLARTMTVRRKAQSTWRASLSKLWSFRKPSTISTLTHPVPVFHLQRFVQFYKCMHTVKARLVYPSARDSKLSLQGSLLLGWKLGD